MPNKWTRPRSLGELQNQSFDHTERVFKFGSFGWSGSAYVAMRVDSSGQLYAHKVENTPVTKTANYSTAQTDATVWTPASGKSIVLTGVLISTDTAMTIQLESSNVDVIPPCYFAANGGAVVSGAGSIWKGAADATLDITSSTDGNHSILLWGYEE